MYVHSRSPIPHYDPMNDESSHHNQASSLGHPKFLNHHESHNPYPKGILDQHNLNNGPKVAFDTLQYEESYE